MHEHAVAKRHSAEPDVIAHGLERSRSAACSRAAAGPGRPSPTGFPSTLTTGTTSRIDEVSNASSAAASVGERKRALVDGVRELAHELPRASRRAGRRRPSPA